MPKKEIKKPSNKYDMNEILLAINENIGIAILELSSGLEKIRETNEEILRALKKRR